MRMSEVEKKLRAGEVVEHPVAGLRGKAKRWAGKYAATWNSVQNNLRADGYCIGVIRGPKGGTTTKATRFYIYLPSASEIVEGKERKEVGDGKA